MPKGTLADIADRLSEFGIGVPAHFEESLVADGLDRVADDDGMELVGEDSAAIGAAIEGVGTHVSERRWNHHSVHIGVAPYKRKNSAQG